MFSKGGQQFFQLVGALQFFGNGGFTAEFQTLPQCLWPGGPFVSLFHGVIKQRLNTVVLASIKKHIIRNFALELRPRRRLTP